MKIHFKVELLDALKHKFISKEEDETPAIVSNVGNYEDDPTLEYVASWNGERYHAKDIGLLGILHINRNTKNDKAAYYYNFWIDTDLYNKADDNYFVRWNYLQKVSLDTLINEIIPIIRDTKLIDILDES